MAPQPLSKVRPKAKFRFGTGAFKNHPELSAIILRVINVGSLIELRFSQVLVDLLKADPRTGMAMYQALSGGEARRATLLAAAQVRLSSDDCLLFRAVLSAITPARKVRNSFAHYLWGESQDLPQTLLLADPEEFLRVDIGAAEANLAMEKTGTVIPPPSMDLSKIQVWTKAGLQRANVQADDALGTVSELGTGIHWFGPGIGAASIELLLKRPPVSQALQRLKKQSGL